jgi:ketosteroid isomerase-like protein
LTRRALFERRVDAWLEADLDKYMQCWAEAMVIELPSGVVEGRDAYRKLVAAAFAWAEPVSFDVHHIAIEDDDIVFADWTIRARRRDDGVLFEWRGLSICRFVDDRIVWWREHHLAPPAPAS